MDPAEINQQLVTVESRLEEQDHRMDQMAQALQTLLARNVNVAPAPVSPPSHPRGAAASHHPGPSANLLPPLRYGGDPEGCRGFLIQVEIHFELAPHAYPSDRAKVAFIINHLTDKALLWANPLWEENKPLVYDYDEFVSAFRRTFDPPGRRTNAAKSLLRLRQGSRSLGAYALEFRSLAAELAWNNAALVAVFLEGLSEELQDETAARDLPDDLENLITYLSFIDERIRHRRNTRDRSRRALPRPNLTPALPRDPTPVPRSNFPALPAPEPMQLGSARLTEAEREYRRAQGLCLYCGQRGHMRMACPNRPENRRT